MKITKRQLYKMIREAGRLSPRDIPIQSDYDEMNVRADYERDARKDRRAEEEEEWAGEPPLDPPSALDQYEDVQWDEDGLPYRWDEKGNYVDLAHLMEGKVKITKRQLRRIIKEEADMMRRRMQTGDAVGAQEASDIAEFLQRTHGLTLSRGGMNQLIEFLSSLEASGDLRR